MPAASAPAANVHQEERRLNRRCPPRPQGATVPIGPVESALRHQNRAAPRAGTLATIDRGSIRPAGRRGRRLPLHAAPRVGTGRAAGGRASRAGVGCHSGTATVRLPTIPPAPGFVRLPDLSLTRPTSQPCCRTWPAACSGIRHGSADEWRRLAARYLHQARGTWRDFEAATGGGTLAPRQRLRQGRRPALAGGRPPDRPACRP